MGGSTMTTERGFGAIIQGLREDRQIGLRQFARMLGMSATYLSKIEREELPPPAEERVKEIARLLERDLDEIIRTQPREMALLLRTARGSSGHKLKQLTEQAKGINGKK